VHTSHGTHQRNVNLWTNVPCSFALVEVLCSVSHSIQAGLTFVLMISMEEVVEDMQGSIGVGDENL
jgi:hypothetical protein